ncbi:phosphorylase b kinase regulatory subunit alpha, skeletal muscle isoform isoform X6 [Arapaima gigas]
MSRLDLALESVNVETVLNRIPQPEDRRTSVDIPSTARIVHIHRIPVQVANGMLYQDQPPSERPAQGGLQAPYNSAPTGRFSTTTYQSKAASAYIQDHLPSSA